MNKIFILIYISIITSGCVWIKDFPRTAWGSSVRVLSDQRVEAETKIFSCPRGQCFEKVVGLTYAFGSKEKEENQQFVLFAKDPRQAYVIVMGVPGCVDTTEVGIFFDALSDHQTKIDVSSLSSRAKREVARIIFDEMARAYDVVQDVSE